MNTHWTKLTGKYFDNTQCLASFIAWQAAEVIAGVKPANLINVFDRELACGRNMLTLWTRYRSSVLAGTNVKGTNLQKKASGQLVLIYNPTGLETILNKTPVKKALRSLGYDYETVDAALEFLKIRLQGEAFPHEIGFFLGYPVKDVFGFMGLCDLPVAGRSPWKMYGKLESSLAVLNKHTAARKCVISELCSGNDPMSLIKRLPEYHRAA